MVVSRLAGVRLVGLVLLLAGLLVSLGACGAPPQEAIIGAWEMQGQPETIEFLADGSVINKKENTVLYSGTYQFLDESHIKIFTEKGNPNSPSATLEIEIRANQMVMIQETSTGIRMGVYTKIP